MSKIDILTKDKIKDLLAEREGWLISFYMPTFEAGKEVEQNRIRFKNLVAKAEKILRERGIRDPESLLEPTGEILGDEYYWNHQGKGFAGFLSQEGFQYYRLPIDFTEVVEVNKGHFHLKPLLPLLSHDGRFYVLALSQNQVSFYQGSQYNIDPVHLEDLPESLVDALSFEDPERRLQFHTGTPEEGTKGTRGKRPAIFHGQGGGTPEQKNEIIKRFLHKVEPEMTTFLQDSEAPLILAGVDYVIDIYKEVNNYQNLLEEHVSGNPESWTEQEVWEKAWPLAKEILGEQQREAIEEYRELSDSQKAAQSLPEVLDAAYQGRVKTLLVARNQNKWGQYDPMGDKGRKVNIHDEQRAGDRELLDFAAIQTMLKGGKVFALEDDELLATSGVGAVIRF